MRRLIISLLILAPFTGAALAADATGIDSLRGQFTFNWHVDPGKTRCERIDDRQLALFKSDTFTCDLKVVTNTASGKPAVVCTKKGGKGEYLIFSTKAACDLERRTQESNGD